MFETGICLISLAAFVLAVWSLAGKITPAAAAVLLAIVELLRCLPAQ